MAAEDLDEMLVYLASDAARSVTGSIFTVDDGQSL
jgi:enoyl-[acyl-carrier-protein] reductase (NADH)